jgi:hypothetical protein
MRRSLILALLIGISAPALAAQDAADPATRIGEAIERAQAAGIPVALLESKIAEGQAKGIPMDRIAMAVERRGEALLRAQEAIARTGESAGEADLAASADALESGVSEVVLEAVFSTAPQERRAVALAALAQLVEMGHVPQDALDRVQEALARGPEALANLPAQAAAARGLMGPPEGMGPGAQGQAGPPAVVPAPGQPPAGVQPPVRRGPPGGGF